MTSDDVKILIETNISNEVYCSIGIGYDVVCFPGAPTAAGGAQGVVVMVVQDITKNWRVDLICFQRGSIQRPDEPIHQDIAPSLHLGAPPRLEKGTGPLQVPVTHCDGIP